LIPRVEGFFDLVFDATLEGKTRGVKTLKKMRIGGLIPLVDGNVYIVRWASL